MKIAGEWELTPEDVAALFAAKGWCYHTDQGLVIPNAKSIQDILSGLISQALAEKKDEVQGYRFMVWKDPDLPYSYDVWLNVGYIWDNDALTADQREALPTNDEDDEDGGGVCLSF